MFCKCFLRRQTMDADKKPHKHLSTGVFGGRKAALGWNYKEISLLAREGSHSGSPRKDGMLLLAVQGCRAGSSGCVGFETHTAWHDLQAGSGKETGRKQLMGEHVGRNGGPQGDSSKVTPQGLWPACEMQRRWKLSCQVSPQTPTWTFLKGLNPAKI